MDAYQQLVTTLALTMGTAWAAGINLYATIAVLGVLGVTGNLVLPEGLMLLQDPLVIGVACLMYLVEFFADKTPGVDTTWDAIHSFMRIPAGVMLAGCIYSSGHLDSAENLDRSKNCLFLDCPFLLRK